jgi:hypothetical protein
MALYNWAIPVSSLLNHLQKGGYKIFSVYDGEETTLIDQNLSDLTARKKAVEDIVSVDYSCVTVQKNNKMYGIHIVLDNDPDELVADYTDDEELETVIDKYNEQWEGKKCPTIEE